MWASSNRRLSPNACHASSDGVSGTASIRMTTSSSVKNGAAAFASILEKTKSVVDFQIDVLSSQYDISTEAGRMRATRAVLETIACTPNPIQQDTLISHANPRLGHASPGVLRSELVQIMRRAGRRSVEPQAVPAAGKQPKEEIELVEHVVAGPELIPLVEKYLPLTMMTDPLCRSLMEAALEAQHGGVELTSAISQRDAPDGELSLFAAKIQMAPFKAAGKEFSREEAVKGLILSIWRRKLKRRAAELDRLRTTEDGKNNDALSTESAQVRTDIKLLDKWDTGSTVIQVLL